MTACAFPAAEVIARLSDKVRALREIGNSADVRTAIESQPRAVPAAYVLVEERGEKPAGASGGVLIQQVSVAIQVVLIVRNYRQSDTGAAARVEMDVVADLVDGALLNWTVPGFKPVWFTAGRDERFESAQLVHQRVYGTGRRIQVNRNP